MALPERTLTAAGHELQFAPPSRHFRLAVGLHRAARRRRRRTIVAVSSSAHLRSPSCSTI